VEQSTSESQLIAVAALECTHYGGSNSPARVAAPPTNGPTGPAGDTASIGAAPPVAAATAATPHSAALIALECAALLAMRGSAFTLFAQYTRRAAVRGECSMSPSARRLLPVIAATSSSSGDSSHQSVALRRA
jgi:hypothetical protein